MENHYVHLGPAQNYQPLLCPRPSAAPTTPSPLSAPISHHPQSSPGALVSLLHVSELAPPASPPLGRTEWTPPSLPSLLLGKGAVEPPFIIFAHPHLSSPSCPPIQVRAHRHLPLLTQPHFAIPEHRRPLAITGLHRIDRSTTAPHCSRW
jgi:hypothetical protein